MPFIVARVSFCGCFLRRDTYQGPTFSRAERSRAMLLRTAVGGSGAGGEATKQNLQRLKPESLCESCGPTSQPVGRCAPFGLTAQVPSASQARLEDRLTLIRVVPLDTAKVGTAQFIEQGGG